MSPLIGANGNYSGLSVPAPDTHGGMPVNVPASSRALHIAKADGLHGDLGLYAVTVNGATRHVTREELTAAASEAKSGGASARAVTPQPALAAGGIWSWVLEIYMKQIGDELNEVVNQM